VPKRRREEAIAQATGLRAPNAIVETVPVPGKYRIKFLARDDETGRIGTYQTTFVIPNLNKEDKRAPISSVVLSSQRVEQNEALFDAANGKDKAKEAAVNPLVQDGKKLVPSVTRVRMNPERSMHVGVAKQGLSRLRFLPCLYRKRR
jgi:hypothetical protein